MSLEEIARLESEAAKLKDSPAKVALLEHAVKLADSMDDLKKRVELRRDLVRAAMYAGVDDVAIVAFSWCLAQSDKEPVKFPDESFLWQYKWILAVVASFPGIKREKIEEMASDYERRLKRNGYGLRSLYKLRRRIACDMGDTSLALKYHAKWRASSPDAMADCRACETDSEVSFLVGALQYEEAIEKALPILEGRLKCNSVPERTYGDMVFAHLSLGNLDEAKEAFEIGYPQVVDRHNLIDTIASHLIYLARVVDVTRGLKLIERHLRWACESNSPTDRMSFFAATGNFFERVDAVRPGALKVSIPSTLAIHQANDTYTPADLANWFQPEVKQLADRFDIRNGNNFQTWKLASTRALAFGSEIEAYVESK